MGESHEKLQFEKPALSLAELCGKLAEYQPDPQYAHDVYGNIFRFLSKLSQ